MYIYKSDFLQCILSLNSHIGIHAAVMSVCLTFVIISCYWEGKMGDISKDELIGRIAR